MSSQFDALNQPIVQQQQQPQHNSAPFPSFRARSTSSSTLNPNHNTTTVANTHSGGGGGGGIASPAWLNALSDGLSWIETSKAAQKAAEGAVGIAGIGMGVGESIRDGLSARLTAAGGEGNGNRGLVGGIRRPLSFTGWGGQFPGAGGGGGGAGSTGRSSIDESIQQLGSSGISAVDLTDEAATNGNTDVQESHQPRIMRHRPGSFLEYIRPNPSSPSPKRDSISRPQGRPAGFEEHDAQSNSSSGTLPSKLLKPPLATSVSSPAPPPPPPSFEISSQRRRLGPPQPANLTRLGSTHSAETDRSSSGGTSNTPAGPAGQRFLRNAAHRPSFSGSSVPPPATGGGGGAGGGGIISLPRSASSSTYSLHEQTKQTHDGSGGAGLARSSSSGFNHARPTSVHTASSGTSTPVGVARQTTLQPQPQPQRSRSHSLMQTQTMQRTQSGSSSHLAQPSGPTPYRPGFQPAGVRTYRTDEYVEARKRKVLQISREEGRLGRRWGKLIDLHFNPSTLLGVPGAESAVDSGTTAASRPGKLARSSSTKSNLSLSPLFSSRRSFLSMDALSSQLDNIKPRDVWRGIRNVSGVGVEQVEAEKKREAEMAIVKWEEDRETQATTTSTKQLDDASSISSTGERGLINPNTGLPVGMRRDKCSLLLVADWKTGKGQEVEEGFVGWLKVDSESAPNGKPTTGGGAKEDVQEVMIKGVRVCRECWQTVSRKQQMQERQRITGFTKLYEALKAVETEIEDYLPEFREMIIQLQSDHFPQREISRETVSLHKQLVALFQDYEKLTKRIRDQPCEVGETQWRLQQGIARAAGLFIAKEAGIIQASSEETTILPRIQRQRYKRTASSIASVSSTPALSDAGSGRPMSPLANKRTPGGSETDENVALMLQPLLEQEAQIEEYIREANAQRKFDDVRTLKTSLEEIQEEIARLAEMS
ncbi:hypothetical protein QFC21_002368 [Naganishia friedmannii]|uniref:Uncharacterized protein n=1 Tax=Naganishia friedmannii TaxID=89922 RepID=A0ACC2VYH8_9TREE|nr:hypothetical protein QFC21_002368 [Naganishia friedmannii]